MHATEVALRTHPTEIEATENKRHQEIHATEVALQQDNARKKEIASDTRETYCRRRSVRYSTMISSLARHRPPSMHLGTDDVGTHLRRRALASDTGSKRPTTSQVLSDYKQQFLLPTIQRISNCDSQTIARLRFTSKWHVLDSKIMHNNTMLHNEKTKPQSTFNTISHQRIQIQSAQAHFVSTLSEVVKPTTLIKA
jgi:hypothetical protein